MLTFECYVYEWGFATLSWENSRVITVWVRVKVWCLNCLMRIKNRAFSSSNKILWHWNFSPDITSPSAARRSPSFQLEASFERGVSQIFLYGLCPQMSLTCIWFSDNFLCHMLPTNQKPYPKGVDILQAYPAVGLGRFCLKYFHFFPEKFENAQM